MSESQFYVLVSLALVGIMLNGGLFIYLGGRFDSLSKQVGELASKLAVPEDRHGR